MERQLNIYKEEIYNEMQKQMLSGLYSFISGIVHEIRSPLQAIDNSIDLLTEDNDENIKLNNNHRREILKMLKTSVSSIGAITTNITSFGRIKNYNSDAEIFRAILLDIKEIEINELVKSTIDIFKCTTEYKDCQIKIEYIDNMEYGTKIMCSEFVIRQIVMNLLSNAFKAIITYRSKQWAKADGLIVVLIENTFDDFSIRIKDNGRGLPEEDRDKLFLPFNRIHRDMPGSGFGLYMCKLWATNAKMDLYLDHSIPGDTEFILNFKKEEFGNESINS